MDRSFGSSEQSSMTSPFDGMMVFARVVEAGGFSRAAEELGVTKSSVSEAVRRLEARLGVRLLDRTTRRLAATDAGRAFYARCRAALAEAEAGRAEAQALHSEPIGPLRVAAPEAFARLHMAPAMAALLASHPGLRLELVEGAQAVDLIEAGFDLAIRITPQPAENLVVRRLGTSRVLVVASPGYLAAHPAPSSPQEVVAHRTIAYSPLFWSREWRFERQGERADVPVQPTLLSNSAETLRAAALAGLGLAAVPRWLVADDLADGRLVPCLADWTAPESGIYAVYPSNRLMAAKVKLFVDHVARHLRAKGL